MDSDPSTTTPEPRAATPTSYAAEQQLPPVEPPAASFIIQLFLIPMLIVSMIVAVWLMFSWLARSGEDPQELVTQIERLNQSSWQQAMTFAQQLRDPRNAELRQDTETASRFATLLESQVAEGRDNKDRVQLRMYLCRVLGEFEIPTGFPALAQAAVTEGSQSDLGVRRAALQAIGLLADKVGPEVTQQQDEALAAVLKGTEEYGELGEEKLQRELLRSTSTYVLGMFPQDEATGRLVELLHDPSLDVGYNAAIGLARRGDERAIPVLADMLDPPQDALINPDPLISDSQQAGQQQWKRSHIISSALISIGKLHKNDPAADLGELPKTIAQLADDDDLPSSLQIKASEVLRTLE